MKKVIFTLLVKASFVLLFTIIMFGCNVNPDNEFVTGEIGTPELLHYLGEQGFDTEKYFIEDGQIVVEGDIAFDIESLKADIQNETTRQYRHGYIVSQSKVKYITVRTTSGMPSAWSSALTTSISAWNGISTSTIKFVRVSSSSYAHITISHYRTNKNYVAKASFPNSSGNPGRTINVNPAFDFIPTSEKRFVMVHEMGHCIGMRHINNNESGRILIQGTPRTDSKSVMHPYVKPWGGFSTHDINAASLVYPTSTYHPVLYRAHVKSNGWLDWVMKGQIGGTTGKNKRMEAVQIKIFNMSGSKIQYRAHVKGKGWLSWVNGGQTAGTTGQNRRMEAIQIKLVGLPSNMKIKYRAHVQGKGWLPWVMNGATAGTIGKNKRVEALQVLILC